MSSPHTEATVWRSAARIGSTATDAHHRRFDARHWLLCLLMPLTATAGDYPLIGYMRSRASTDIVTSIWSVGAETMDRDYTDYEQWKPYLAPLGAKRARVQSGWAKTEPVPGTYNWAWLDAIIPDMAAKGVKPWVCLSYGVRYGNYADEWEIWNEPNIITNFTATDYGAFLERTARTIRRVQTGATIVAFALAGTGTNYVHDALEVLRTNGTLNLVNDISYHPYDYNPDTSYAGVTNLRRAVKSCAPHLDILQGENGAPSVRGGYGALADYDWTEMSQAKWAARRLLGDLGRDIRSSYFSICDMLYDGGRNYKGLLDVAPDKSVLRPKHAYSVVQPRTPGELVMILSPNGSNAVTVESDLPVLVQTGRTYYVAASFDVNADVIFHIRDLTGGGPLTSATRVHGLSMLHDATGTVQVGTYNGQMDRVWKGTLDELRWSRTVVPVSELLVSGPPSTVIRLR